MGRCKGSSPYFYPPFLGNNFMPELATQNHGRGCITLSRTKYTSVPNTSSTSSPGAGSVHLATMSVNIRDFSNSSYVRSLLNTLDILGQTMSPLHSCHPDVSFHATSPAPEENSVYCRLHFLWRGGHCMTGTSQSLHEKLHLKNPHRAVEFLTSPHLSHLCISPRSLY